MKSYTPQQPHIETLPEKKLVGKRLTMTLAENKTRANNRPHFGLLGDRYKNDDPASEEEIWIPVKK